MPPIDTTGTYKGTILDFSVGKTRKSGLPQFICKLLATQYYDEPNEAWVDWSAAEQTIMGYFVLVTLDGKGQVVKCPNYDSLMEAVGWDGISFTGLAKGDWKGIEVQFTVAENEYNGTVTLQVGFINHVDAQIGMRKLTDADLASLDQQFSVATQTAKTAARPPKAKAKPPKTKTASPKTTAPPPPVLEGCDMNEAWGACVTANEALNKPVPDEILGDYWTGSIGEIAPGIDVKDVTGEQWARIRESVLLKVDIPF